MLNEIKAGKLSVSDAADSFARDYNSCLIELQNIIAEGFEKSPVNHRFFREIRAIIPEIMRDKSSLKYIDGMLQSALDFRARIHPSSSDPIVLSPKWTLYEQVA